VAFDMEKDMKTMWGAMWSLSGWSTLQRIQFWTMLIVGICIFARASELTVYCPTMEDTFLPEAASQWDSDGVPRYIEIALHTFLPEAASHWDSDGVPRYIEIALRKWKRRTPSNNTGNKPYKMRLWRNYLDTRFCPVTWLLTWLHFSGITEGPIFQEIRDGKPSGKSMSEKVWTGATTKLFTAAGLYTPAHDVPGVEEETTVKIEAKSCTNHSLRRSAAQWAGRCNAATTDVANAGRWKTFTEMMKYLAQGAKTRLERQEDQGCDPIFSTWVFKPVTVGGESTRNEL